jgi:hypothetical protein
MKKTLKTLVIAAMALAIIMPIMPVMALDLGTNAANSIGLGAADPKVVAVNIIHIVLGFLGLLAVIMILIGGFKWMTAAGNEDSIAEAKKILIAAIIGLLIILASWAITNFVITQFLNAMNTTT